MVNKLKILILAFVSYTSSAQSTDLFFAKTDAFFKTYVQQGKVNYKAIQQNPDGLNEVVKLGENSRVSIENADEYKAFWINTYNVWVIKSVVDNYPLQSPLDVPGFFDTENHQIGGLQTTLNTIENEFLRANFPEEPRFHFVLVCAGLGCPPIIAEAYLPNTLNAQLQAQTLLALNDPAFIQQKGGKVSISQIFEWYKQDFEQNGQNLIDFINQYRKEKLSEKTKLSFYPYNWNLNEIQ